MQPEDEKLAEQCEKIAQTLQEATHWIADNPQRVGQNSAGLQRELRKQQLLARNLAIAARRKMAVSVFGPSQAGKSYLVSALARPGTKPVMANFAGASVNFIEKINPEGGRESTGIVTRFTLDRSSAANAEYPVELRLLTQTDLVKIIGNTYYADCCQDDFPDPAPEDIAQRLTTLAAKAASSAVDHLKEDDIYDLEEYFWRYFRGMGRVKVLKNVQFWSEAAQLAPRLRPADRAQLFALLWGDVEPFTKLYLRLYTALEKLGFAANVCCPLAALMPREMSIIDVQMLQGLGNDGADKVAVLAGTHSVELPRAEVTALTAELKIVLEQAPCGIDGTPYAFFQHTDLLDFPGARSREQIKQLPDHLRSHPDALSGFFLRGKVAYLFERYCAEQELTSMLLCIGPGNQEVHSLPDMVNDWIASTHGASSTERQGAPVSLFLILSKFDMEFEQKAGASDDPKQRWSIRLHSSLLDFFGKQHEWPQQWDSSGGFRNTFWLRNPNFKQKAIFDYDGDQERQIRPSEQEYIAKLGHGFVDNPDVCKHFKNPQQAWDAAMLLNDGGIGYLVQQLAPVCQPELKRQQVARRLQDLISSVNGRLAGYYVSDDTEAERNKKQTLGKALARKLVNCAVGQRFGAFLSKLYVDDELLYDLYFQVERTPSSDDENAATVHQPEVLGAQVDADSLLDLFSDDVPDAATDAAARPAPIMDAAARYASAVIAQWLSRLRELSADKPAQAYFGLNAEEFSALVHELDSGAARLKLRDSIAAAVRDASHFHNIERQKLAWKQAALAAALLNTYINYLGIDVHGQISSRPHISITGHQRPIFAPRPSFDDVPQLEPKPLPYDRDFYADWLYALTLLIQGNVAGALASAADVAQNQRLGILLKALSA